MRVKKDCIKQRRSKSFKPVMIPVCRMLAGAGLVSLGGMGVPLHVLAATTGSLSGANIHVSDSDTITADNGTNPGSLYGVLNPSGQTGTVSFGNNVTVSANNPAAAVTGIDIQGNGSLLKANALTVEVTGNSATGINLSGRAVSADLGADTQIIVQGAPSERAMGIQVSNASLLNADRLSVETNGDYGTGISVSNYGSSASLGSVSKISTNGRLSYGVYIDGLNGTAANGPARLTADALNISTQGYGAAGLNIQKNAIVDLGLGSTVSTSGDNAHGIWNFGKISAAGLSVNARGSGANGIEVRGGTASIGEDSHIRSTLGGGLVTNGVGTTINFAGTADARNTINAGGSYGASAQTVGSKINLRFTDLTVDRSGALALGLWALNGGTITGDNLRIKGGKGTRGVYAMSDSRIELTGDLDINMASPAQMAIATQHDEGYAASQINATGKMRINGSVYARGGVINLDMAPDSSWTGTAFTDNVNGGRLGITMSDSTWHVFGDSAVDNLSLNNATVDLAGKAPSSGTFTTLNAANLDGSGRFIMRTDVKRGAGDLLRFTGTSAGNHVLTFRNQGSIATDGSEVLTVVETADGGASFTSLSQVELGGYLYDVRRNGTNWEIYAAGAVPVPAPTPDSDSTTAPTPVPDPAPLPGPAPVPAPSPSPAPKPLPTTTADAGGNYLNVGYLMTYAENQTLMQRMGDMRRSGSHGNMWFNSYGGSFNSFSGSRLSGFDMHYSGLQIGADKRLTDDIPLYIGAFLGSTHASPDYRGGSGTFQSDYAGLYASYESPEGFYSDALLKSSWHKNSFSVRDTQSNWVTASGNASGFSASLETGRKVSLPLWSGGYYAEPQVQLTWSHQNSATVRASNGLNIGLGSYEALLGRAGVLLGYEKKAGSSHVNLYFKSAAIREFLGDTGFSLNGTREDHSFKGNGWINGIGISAQLRDSHTLHAEADYTDGNRFDQTQLNLGYRFTF